MPRITKTTGTTLVDVARLAGVHFSTVSNVVNNAKTSTRVSEATRRRILAAAAELRYVPNRMARGLKRRRTNTLGVIVADVEPEAIFRNPYAVEVMSGVMNGAVATGHNITLLHNSWREAAHPAECFLGQGLDGILLISPVPGSPLIAGLTDLGIPQVAISGRAEELGVPAVDIDNREGVRLALEHLLAAGHRNIAFIADSLPKHDSRERRAGFLAALAEAGLPDAKVVDSRYPSRLFYLDARRLLAQPHPPTAIMAHNDTIAFEVLNAARDLGIAVPACLSVVGFDDYPGAAYSGPPLTTVRQPLMTMGAHAVQLLADLVEGGDVPVKTFLYQPELVVRGSTGAPRGD